MSKTKYELHITGECKQNLKLCKKRGLPMQELWDVVEKLLCGEQLEEKYLAHKLHGNRKNQWECHIQPNWLLIWEQHDRELVLIMVNTGTHSDLFGKKNKK
jgi:mRNA interferase YafQ